MRQRFARRVRSGVLRPPDARAVRRPAGRDGAPTDGKPPSDTTASIGAGPGRPRCRMNVLVFEPDPTGHRFTGVRNLIDGLLALQVRVAVATTAAARATDEYRIQLSPVEPLVRLLEVPPVSAGGLRGTLQRRAAFADALAAAARRRSRLRPVRQRARPSTGALRPLRNPVPPGVEVEGLLMRGSFAYPQTTRTARLKGGGGPVRAQELAPPHVPLDGYLLATTKSRRRGGRLARRSVLIPTQRSGSAAHSSGLARRRLGIPVDGPYLELAGVLDVAKGIDRLLAAFAFAPLRADDRLLLMAVPTPGFVSCWPGRASR